MTTDATEQIVGPERREREVIADFQLPIADLNRAARSTQTFQIMRYAMIIEPGERNYSAYLPELPGCVDTGKTIEELRQRMSEAIELHLDGSEDGLPIPEPT